MMGKPALLLFDELPARVGSVFGPGAPIMVDQDMIDRFAALTGDRQWVHVDVNRAQKAIGGTIAHGYLTLSLVPRVFANLVAIGDIAHGLNYGLDRVRFPAPLWSGSTVSGTVRIAGTSQHGDELRLRCEIAITAEGADRPVCVAETLVLLFKGEGVLGA